ncbi:GIY-YIG nuclease family protein [Mycolicibacterium frederiksbergense]|uniref:GIY-YIG nuclease family protein n=1 Tax=Mycolicibacterium frederiksbergense TaxID=117567 RepID=UPI00355761FD
MYAWWGDQEAQAALGTPIDLQLGPLLYVGQAGATKWPSGKRSLATLVSRIGRQHIRGNTRSSTFRRTVSALLLDRLALVSAGGGRLDRPSNSMVSAWIAEHLRVGIAPFDDRDSLGLIEKLVLKQLDPPLNLGQCVPSDSRGRLTALRARL